MKYQYHLYRDLSLVRTTNKPSCEFWYNGGGNRWHESAFKTLLYDNTTPVSRDQARKKFPGAFKKNT